MLCFVLSHNAPSQEIDNGHFFNQQIKAIKCQVPASCLYLAPKGGGGGGYSGFQVTGMIKGFFGVSNFRFWDFFGQENFGKFFFGQLDFSFLETFMARKSRHGNIFWGLNFGSGIFLGFDFGPHSIIPVT